MRAPSTVSVTISEPKAEFSLNSALTVVSLVPGGAAERAGVRVGDKLLAVGGAEQQQGDAGSMQTALAAIKSAPRPVSLLFARDGEGSSGGGGGGIGGGGGGIGGGIGGGGGGGGGPGGGPGEGIPRQSAQIEQQPALLRWLRASEVVA